jgi:UDP-glucose 4-epimerase
LKIVITGGCGFIGINLVHHLLSEFPEVCVRILDNFHTGTPEDLGSVCQPFDIATDELTVWKKGTGLIQGDVCDADLAFKVCHEADVVVHLAANTGIIPSIENPRMDCQINVGGVFNYLEACRINQVKSFIFASSGAPLGEQAPPIHEEKVPRPISPYGASKLCGEAYASAYFGSFGVKTVCLRFGNVYGPRSKHKDSVVAKFIKQIKNGEDLIIYGDGTQTRDFIYIDDLCRAITSALPVSKAGGEIFQIATNKERTVGEIAEILNQLGEKYFGRQSRIIYADPRKGEVKRNYSDIRKAQKVLEWSPIWRLEDGLEETVKWFTN